MGGVGERQKTYPAGASRAGLAATPETRQGGASMTPPSADAFRLDHVAVAVPRVADAAPLLAGTLGGRPAGSGPGLGFRWWQWEFARGARLEMLEPDGPPGGFLHRFLARGGTGIHHVTVKVPRLEDAVSRAESQGYDIVGLSTEWPAWKEAFLHPHQAQGIVVQLAEAHPDLEPDDAPSYPFPEVASGADPAELLGVRLVATSGAQARRLWQDTLGATCSEEHGTLVFRWPESPLRIAVSLDAAAVEGPIALELAPRADLALPEGPHPALGTALLPVA
jgi:methylmalonyl-CoA/ethylmalonyl-CoA epimerase